jgi:hypothetical protein
LSAFDKNYGGELAAGSASKKSRAGLGVDGRGKPICQSAAGLANLPHNDSQESDEMGGQ